MQKNTHIFHGVSMLIAIGMMSSMLSGCADENGLQTGTDVYETPCIQLTFDTGMGGSRAEGDEEKDEKLDFTDAERQMKTVDLFFYASGADETAKPVKTAYISDTKHGAVHSIFIPNDSIVTVFGTDNKCKVYAVVNVSDADYKAANITEKTEATISDLRAIKVTTPGFATTFDGLAMFSKEDAEDFGVVTYNPDTRKAEGTVRLQNLAAKIDLFVSFGSGDTKTVSGVDPNKPEAGVKNWNAWNPANTRQDGKVTRKGSAEVYLVNGSTVVPLKGWETSDFDGTTIPNYIENNEYFDLRNDNGKYSRCLDEVTSDIKAPEGSEYFTESAIYSYPNKWTTDIFEQHQTYLMLKVNWLPDDIPDEQENVESDLLETYYKIPINLTGDSENKLLHNRYYRVKVNINTLGGQNFGAPMELEASCEVLPWGGTKLNADIFTVRYLEVTQSQTDPYMADPEVSEYQAIMQNTNIAYIPYKSSHKIKLSEVTMQYYNFNPSSGYAPEKVGILTRRDNNNKVNPYPNKDGISVPAFLLDEEKFDWFKKYKEEPNGVVIDEANSRIIFYHSVYPLAGYDPASKERPDAPVSGIYGAKGDKTYSPFFITLKIEHVDDPGTYEYINILQYPGVFVTFIENTGKNSKGISIGRRVSNGNGTNNGGTEGDRRGVYINGGATATFAGFNGNDGANSLQLGGIGGTGRINNPFMYSIHVTQLSEDEIWKNVKFGHSSPEKTIDVMFHIGDPRTKNINNNLSGVNDLTDTYIPEGWDATSYPTPNILGATDLADRSNFRKFPATIDQGGAQRLYDKDKPTLTYYYPTAEDQTDEHTFMLAPVFRLASSMTEVYLGKQNLNDRSSDKLTRENARRRCAALQENGYPAGRWRLPTMGELMFFKMLQNRNVIPVIFPKDGNEYRALWTAQSLVKFEKDNSDVRLYYPNDGMDHKWVRCVYDDWYWVKDDGSADIITFDDDRIQGDKDPDYLNGVDLHKYYGDDDKRTMFVWGDKPKNNPQDQPQDQTPNP